MKKTEECEGDDWRKRTHIRRNKADWKMIDNATGDRLERQGAHISHFASASCQFGAWSKEDFGIWFAQE